MNIISAPSRGVRGLSLVGPFVPARGRGRLMAHVLDPEATDTITRFRAQFPSRRNDSLIPPVSTVNFVLLPYWRRGEFRCRIPTFPLKWGPANCSRELTLWRGDVFTSPTSFPAKDKLSLNRTEHDKAASVNYSSNSTFHVKESLKVNCMNAINYEQNIIKLRDKQFRYLVLY